MIVYYLLALLLMGFFLIPLYLIAEGDSIHPLFIRANNRKRKFLGIFCMVKYSQIYFRAVYLTWCSLDHTLKLP